MKRTRKFRWTVVVAGLMAAIAVSRPLAVAAADRCYSDWSEAAPLVRQQGLTAAKDLQAELRRRMKGQVVKLTLCKANGSYEYRLVVFEPGGAARNLTLDARRPFDR